MKKFFQGKMKILIMIAFLFLFFFNTVAYSGLASKLAITSEAMFRPITDIRVTGIKLVSASNGALESYSPKYNVDTTTTGFTLPSANSEITYKITVTNYGNVKQTIYKFIKNSVSAEGLNVKLTDFTSVCTDENCNNKNDNFTIVHPEGDSSSESNVKEFLITFTTTNPSSTTINIIEKYDFRSLYYISYNANGGKNAPQSQIKIYGDNLNLTKNEPTRDFYDFKGWSTSSTSTTIEYKAGEIYSPGTDEKVQDVTLYAVWQKKQAKLDLNYNIDGTWYYAGYNNKIQTGIKVNGEDKGYLNDFGGTYDYGTSYEIYGFKIDGVTIPYSKKYTVDGTNHLDISFNTINFKVNDANLGSITPTQIIVIPGTTFTVSGNVITLSDGRIATARTKTITGYTIKILNYTITPNSTTVNAKTMVTANFTKELEKYTISLNGNGATTAGTTAIYEKYNTGIYLDSALTKEMGTNANAITKPTRSYTVSFNANNTGITVPSAITKNYSYSGHYTDATNGTQMINENGYITSSFKNTLYTANGTLYAHWGTKPSVTIPEINKDGYKCTWNTSVDGNGTPYNGGAVTDKLNTQTLYAVCKVDTNTKYVVKHYKQKLDGTYPTEADDIDNLTGTTGASVSPAVKSYTGFTSPSVQTTTIKADGSTVVTYKYTRNKYTFTLGSSTGASTSGSTASGSYYYGSTITLKATANTGYTWSKWTSSNTSLVGNQTTANTTFTMPAGNITMTPSVTTNVLTFNDQSKPVTYNPTSSQTVNISSATNGTGSYSYSIISGNDNSYFSISGTTITVKSNTPANTSGYKITVRVTDTNSKVTKDATITIIVNKKSVTKPTSPANKVYNAEEQNHGISVPEGTSIVTNGSTLKATNVGTYDVIFTLNSNYKWSDGTTSNVTIQWKITAYNLSNATIGSISDQTYTGSEIKPTPSVTVPIPSGSKSTPTYTTTYSNNMNVGTATITLTGTGNYTGTKSKTFKIVPAENPVKVTANDLTYNTQAQSLVATKDVQGTICYSLDSVITSKCSTSTVVPTAINAGTYTVYYYINGNSNYKEKSGSVIVTIKKYDLSTNGIIGTINDQTYTESEIKPTPLVTASMSNVGVATLVNNTDYTYSYSNNINAGTTSNPYATVNVTGKGNYTGTKSKTFKIIKATNPTVITANDLTYNAAEQTLVTSSKEQGYICYSLSAVPTSCSANSALAKGTNAGTYTVYYLISGNSNYNSKSGSVKVSIKQYDISKTATIGIINDQVYTGNAIKPTPNVTVPIPTGKTTTLVNNTDFTYSYSNNKNIGTANITITGQENYTGTKSTTFKISQKASLCTITSVPSLKYPSNATGSIQFKCTGDGKITVTSSSTGVIEVTNTGTTGAGLKGITAGKSKITVSQAAGNYEASSASADVTVTYSQYTVTLDGNGATTQGSTTAVATYNSTTLSTITNPIREYTITYDMGTTGLTKPDNGKVECRLNGWYTSSNNGTKVANNNTTPVLEASVSGYTNASKQWTKRSDATLYAGWEVIGTKLPIIEKEGNTCTWIDNNGSSFDSGQTGYTILTNKTLTARCLPNSYVLTVDPNGGKWNNTISASTVPRNYGTEYEVANPTRKGYTFTGWTKSGAGSWNSETNKYTFGAGAGTLTANWTPIKYNIKYELDGGVLSTTNPTEYTVETETFTLNNPTKEGYIFKGWSTSLTSTSSYNATMKVEKGSTGDKEFRAVWQIITYNISYNLNGGTLTNVSNPTSYNITTETFTLNNPTRKGYTFKGWTGSNGNTAQTSVSIAKGSMENKSYTANWTPIKYNIKYELDGGVLSTTNPTEYTVETETFTLNNPTKEGYIFKGWSTSLTSTSSYNATMKVEKGSTGDKEFRAVWQIITYNISYNLNGGTLTNVSNPTSYNITTETFTLNNPTRKGYTFKGWTGSNGNTAQTSVSIAKGSMGNKSYTANWTPIKYSIKYELDGGVLSAANPTEYTVETETFTLNNPTKEGYTFKGWSTSLTSTSSYNATMTVEKGSTGDKEFRAVWQENTNTLYKVNHCTKDLNASTYTCESETKTGTTNSVIKVENLKKTIKGFKYSKGQVDGKDVTETTILANGKREISLYYEREIYTVKLSVNSGINKVSIVATGYETKIGNSSAAATGTYEYGTKITINAEVSTGYSFKAWTYNGASSLQDVNTSENAFTLTKNETYMATAQINQYTLTIDPSGGTWNDSTSASAVIRNYRETYSLSKPTRTGYIFAGWSLTTKYPDTCNDECKDKIEENVYTFGSISGSIKANWLENTYTVKFNANGGTGTMNDQTFNYTDSKALTANSFTRTGYTFTGWSTSANGTVVYKDEQSVSKLSSTNNEVVNLYAQWEGNIYKIALNNTDASFVSDSESIQRNKEVYLKYGDGVYLNNTNGILSNKMTASTNNIYKPIISLGVDVYESYDSSNEENKPTGTMYINYPFMGYYSSDGIQLIDANGNITNSFTNTLFTSDSIITMKTGNQKYDSPVTKKDGYTFEGWFNKPGVGSDASPSVKVDENYQFITEEGVTKSIYAHWLKNVEIKTDVENGDWTYDSVSVSPIDKSTSDSGNVSYQYCFLDNESSCSESDWKEITDTSAVTVIGGEMDEEGNYVESSIDGYIRYRAVSKYAKTPESANKHIKIDRVIPSTTLTAYKTGTTEIVESSTWSNSYLEFMLGDSTTGPSGGIIKYCINDYEYKENASDDNDTSSSEDDTSSSENVCVPTTQISSNTAIPVDLTNKKEGTYKVVYNITSNTGVNSETYVYDARVDVTAPTIVVIPSKKDGDVITKLDTVTGSSKSFPDWATDEYIFDLSTSTDNLSGIDSVLIETNKGGLLTTDSNYSEHPTKKTYDDFESIEKLDPIEIQANGYRHGIITATDKAGNSSQFTFEVKIDGVKPVISIRAYNQSGTEIKSGELSSTGLTFKITIDKSGVSGTRVYSCSTATSSYDSSNPCEPSTRLGSGRTGDVITTTGYANTTSMDRIIRVKGVSVTGIESTVKKFNGRIGTAPVDIVVARTDNSSRISTGDYVNSTVKFKLTSKSTNIKYCVNTSKCTPSTAITSGTVKSLTNTGTFYIGYNADSGTTSYFLVHVDKTPPTIKITPYKLKSDNTAGTKVSDTVTNGDLSLPTWVNYGYYFSLSGSTDESGIATTEWEYNDAGSYAVVHETSKSTVYNGLKNSYLASSGYRYAKVTLTDNAGNSRTIAIGVRIDKVPPKLVLNLYKSVDGKKTGKSLKNVTSDYRSPSWVNYLYYFDTTGTTGGSGITSITIQGNASGAITDNKTLIGTPIDITKDKGRTISGQGNRYIRVVAKDRAGNTTTRNVRIFTDLGKPELTWGGHSANGSEMTINYTCKDSLSRLQNSSGTTVSSFTSSVKLTGSGSKPAVCKDRAGNKVTSNSPTWYYDENSSCGVSYYRENCWYEQEYLGMESDYSCITSGHVCKGSSGTKCYCYTKEYTKKVCGESTPVYNTCWHQ